MTGCTKVPRKFQIQATIAALSGQDALLDVGTNAGKTLSMILPCLVSPGTMAIVISPLKRLQAVQVLTYEEYKLKAVAINEDTLNDKDLWKHPVVRLRKPGIADAEQLTSTNGHTARLARIINENRAFVKLIKRVHVDEAHFIYTAGLPHYGLPAFRSAWGGLGDFRVKIGRHIPFHALSGTLPPHIKGAIMDNLLFERKSLLSIKLTSNRPNITYATHEIARELSDFRNLDFLVPVPYPENWVMPKTLVFYDKIDLATGAAAYLDRRLPLHLQQTGVVCHYHGGMSQEYLTSIYDDFSKSDGKCKLLHATEGASTGLDIPDIEVVIQYGISRDVPTTLQRGGRGGRGSKDAIFVIMYEPWVNLIDLSTLKNDFPDPDHPKDKILTKESNKQDRLGSAMIKIIHGDTTCLQQLFSVYLGDETPQANHFTARWCCDRHENESDPSSSFHLKDIFRGRLLYREHHTGHFYYGDLSEPDRFRIVPEKKVKASSGTLRKPEQRQLLAIQLRTWRNSTHSASPLRAVFPSTFILDKKSIAKLARLHPSSFTSPADITKLLGETDEWGLQYSNDIYTVLLKYDQDLEIKKKNSQIKKKSDKKQSETDKNLAMFESAS
ncbi:P-loop containing nucleoside triphosphate hydrolase protein [Panaeolus papilionaceus]|nr:P-loop containing nucleoside triphosphate hydrolase protein [Panaeolus papilionaceus]